jgi:hypothetical protein
LAQTRALAGEKEMRLMSSRSSVQRTRGRRASERWRRLLATGAGVALAFSGIGALSLAPAAAEEVPLVTCTEPQVLAADGVTCEDPAPPAEEEAPALVCADPQVLSADGLSCVDPAPAEETPALVCVDPQVLSADGLACEDPAPAEETPAGTDDTAAKVADEIVVAAAPPARIAFCHATASNQQPYVYIETNIEAFYNAGHIDHVGPVWFDGIDEVWGDIYPPNKYDEDGQNWGAGSEAFVENGCSEAPSDNPGISIEPMDCSYYDGMGSVYLDVTNTNDDYYYELELDGDLVADGFGDDDLSYFAYLEDGTYVVTVTVYDNDPSKGGDEITSVSTEFSLAPCPELGISVEPKACSTGTDGTAMLHLTGLIEGEEYEWMVEGPGGKSYGEGSFVAEGSTLDYPLGDLPPGDYTATVSWTAPDMTETLSSIIIEEPEWPIVITETTTFTIAACPPKPALAATGAGDAGVANLGLLLTVLGVGGLAIARRRQNMTTDLLAD